MSIQTAQTVPVDGVSAPPSESAVNSPLAADSASAGPDDPLVNPLNSWFGGSERNGKGLKDEEAQVATCMASKRLIWIPYAVPAIEPETRQSLQIFRQTYGYGGHPAGLPVVVNPNAEAIKQMDPQKLADYLDALEGPVGANGREGGCRGKARADRAARQTNRSNDPKAIRLWNEMTNDPRYTVAMKQWSDCMAVAGYAGLQTPEDAKFTASTSDSLKSELAIASADVACSKASLWDVLFVLGDAAVRQLGP